MIVSAGECCVLCAVLMAATYISVAEEEGAEPIELPTEEDGTGSHHHQQQLGSDITPACLPSRGCKCQNKMMFLSTSNASCCSAAVHPVRAVPPRVRPQVPRTRVAGVARRAAGRGEAVPAGEAGENIINQPENI